MLPDSSPFHILDSEKIYHAWLYLSRWDKVWGHANYRFNALLPGLALKMCGKTRRNWIIQIRNAGITYSSFCLQIRSLLKYRKQMKWMARLKRREFHFWSAGNMRNEWPFWNRDHFVFEANKMGYIRADFGQVTFWTGQNLGKSHFGQVRIWASHILDRLHFGQVRIWASQILDRSDFG